MSTGDSDFYEMTKVTGITVGMDVLMRDFLVDTQFPVECTLWGPGGSPGMFQMHFGVSSGVPRWYSKCSLGVPIVVAIVVVVVAM